MHGGRFEVGWRLCSEYMELDRDESEARRGRG